MPERASWRDLLKTMIKSPAERERLANAVGVNPLTLERWTAGVSIPRLSNVQQLLQALPDEHRLPFHDLLLRDYPELHSSSVASEEAVGLPSEFFRQVLEARATTPDHRRFWTITHQVLYHALHHLDTAHQGLAIRVVCCMPPSSDGMIHSLRESEGLGSPPWEANLSQTSMFLGAESLAGYVVMYGHAQAIQNLTSESLLPAQRREHEMSVMASPILYANRIAGCLLVSSTQPNAFLSEARQLLIHDYTLLMALAFDEAAFYRLEQIELLPMPPPSVQQRYMASFQRRVVALMKETLATEQVITRVQAEQRAWQQIEAEMLQAGAHSAE